MAEERYEGNDAFPMGVGADTYHGGRLKEDKTGLSDGFRLEALAQLKTSNYKPKPRSCTCALPTTPAFERLIISARARLLCTNQELCSLMQL